MSSEMEVPEGWKLVNLVDLTGAKGLQTGPFGSQLKVLDYTDTGIPIVMPQNIVSSKIDLTDIARTSEIKSSELSRHRLRSGDILFGRRGEIGRIALVSAKEEGFLCGTGCLRARINPNLASPDFVAAYIASAPALAWLNEHAVGQTMLNLNTAIIGALPFLCPPLPEQRRIAEILTSVDEAIAATEALIEQTKRVKQGVLRQLLTRGIGHTRLKQTEIGEIPEGWEVLRIGDIARVKGGKRMPKGRPFADHPTKYPYIRVSDFEDGSVSTKTLMYVLPEDQIEIKNYTISSKDLYISIAGTIGLVGKIPEMLDGAQLTENAAKIVITNKSLKLDYLNLAMEYEGTQRQILSAKGVGGGVPKLALFRIEDILVPVPPANEQLEIAKVIQSAAASEAACRSQLDQLSSLKSALMSDLLTGRKRVTLPTKSVAA